MDLQPITNAVLAGLLSGVEGGDVNVVNAGIIAESRGIRVSETTFNEGAGYGPSLEVRITLHDGTQHSVQGALLRRVGREPRIIGIDEFITEAAPYGPTLVVENRDVPGMIAGMSSALAAGRVNIAQMNLSRDCVGGKAMSIINLDTPADEATLGRIRSIDGILSVRQVLLDP
jgi:D-3-phosphoglycerate dehydrogenase